MSDAAVKEEMRVAFTQKMTEEKGRLDFTQLQSDESFNDIVSSLEDWNDLSGAEKKQRSMSLFGETGRTKLRGISWRPSTVCWKWGACCTFSRRLGVRLSFRMEGGREWKRCCPPRMVPSGWCRKAPCSTCCGIHTSSLGATAREGRLRLG